MSSPQLPPDSPGQGLTGWRESPEYPSYMSNWDGYRYTSHVFWDGAKWVECPSPGWWLASDNNWYPPELRPPAPTGPPAPTPTTATTATTDGFFIGPGRLDSQPTTPSTRRPLRLVGALSAVALIALAASMALVLSGGSNAGASVLTAVNSSLANKTADVTVTISGNAEGVTVNASGSGIVDFTKNAMELSVSTTVSGQQIQEKLIYLENALYESTPDLSQLFPGKSWVSINLSEIEKAEGPNAAGSLDSEGNPVAMLRLLAAQGNTVTPLGSSIIDGTSVQGYSVSINETTLHNDLAKLPSWMRQLTAKTAVGGISYKIYIDGQNLLRRTTLTMHMSVDSLSLSMSETMDLSHYGVPFTVTAPPQAQVVSLQQLLQKASGTSSPSPSSTQANACTEMPMPGASRQAIDYINAVNGDYPGWLQVTQLIQSDNNNVNLQILQLQSKVDTNFLRQLRSIPFTGPTLEPARRLEADVSSYLADMATAEASSNLGSSALWSQMNAVSNDRADASSALRTALGLPQSSCDVQRP
jgi:hypothetical protein